jgi:hypothetical protein
MSTTILGDHDESLGERMVRVETKVEALEDGLKTLSKMILGTLVSSVGVLIMFILDHMHLLGGAPK